MALFNLDKLVGRVANTVNNDVVQPFQRDVAMPLGRLGYTRLAPPLAKAWQTINPNSGYNQAKPVVSQAESRYQPTPAFSALMNGGNPSLGNSFGQPSALQAGLGAAGEYNPANPLNSIQLGKIRTGLGNVGLSSTDTLIHEALHRAWDKNPVDQASFRQAYMKGATQDLREYLANRLTGYKAYKSGPANELMNINAAPPSIQNEIHSYIPEYYAVRGMTPGGPLGNYYRRYYNVGAPANYDKVIKNIKGTLYGYGSAIDN